MTVEEPDFRFIDIIHKSISHFLETNIITQLWSRILSHQSVCFVKIAYMLMKCNYI